ncbi:MAG: hypothetical protein AAGJ81_08920 [Verrucomicrobiota bacterium]
MNLSRCKDQKRQSLEEFYTEFARSESEASKKMGEAMLSLLRNLKKSRNETVAFGLTSHAKLYFLEEDTYESPWYVSVFGTTPNEYRIDYLMPRESQPWSEARVSGRAYSETEAIEMLFTAIQKSDGWTSEK